MESTININDAAVKKMIADQLKRVSNLKPVMAIISQDMETRKDLNFRSAKDPNGKKWALLSVDSTLKNAVLGLDGGRKGDKPLNDTGWLKASLTIDSTNKSAKIGTNLKYAPTHQFGAKKGVYGRTKKGSPIPWGDIPQRRMVGINKKMNNKYKKLVINYVLNGKR